MDLKLIALGGLEENGKNAYVLESEKSILILDIGSKKFDNSSLGVDTVVNSTEYLEKNKNKIKGIFISHSHMDQMGGLEKLIKKIKVPVYGSKYTLEFLKNEIKYDAFKVIKYNETIKLDDLSIEAFSLSHSVFGHLGFCISQGKDAIIYATDYNFNQSRNENTRTDIEKILKLKNKYNIVALLTESINADKAGVASGDLSFMAPFQRLAENINGKLFISLYSQNVAGMLNIIKVAAMFNKKIVIIGKDLLTYVNVSKRLGFIEHYSDMFIKTKDINKYPSKDVIVVVSGDFLEPFETLEKLSKEKHPITTITNNDYVLIASEPFDEIEGIVQKKIDTISRTNCKIKHLNVNVASHAYEEDIKMMINLFDPKYIVPIKGEYRKLKKVQEIALSLGYPTEKIKLIVNGDVLRIKNDSLNIEGFVKVESTLVNSSSKEEIDPLLLYDRETITAEGYVLITLIVNKKSQKLVQKPEVLSGGLMSFDKDQALIDKCIDITSKGLEEGISNDKVIKVKNKIKRHLNNKIGKSPVILTVKIEVK